jgi:uncharacterized protein (DUF58 family)
MLWVMVAVAIAELCIVHLLIALLWSATAALILSLATLGTIVWLVLLIRSFPRLPVLVDEEKVLMRIGSLRRVELPRPRIAAVRTAFAGEEVRSPGVLNLALLAYPNVLVEMAEPVRSGRQGKMVRAVAHRLDDPAAFRAAVAS